MTKKEVMEDVRDIILRIDNCIENLTAARLMKNGDAENDAIFQMETLLVASQQEFSFLQDYIGMNTNE